MSEPTKKTPLHCSLSFGQAPQVLTRSAARQESESKMPSNPSSDASGEEDSEYRRWVLECNEKLRAMAMVMDREEKPKEPETIWVSPTMRMIAFGVEKPKKPYGPLSFYPHGIPNRQGGYSGNFATPFPPEFPAPDPEVQAKKSAFRREYEKWRGTGLSVKDAVDACMKSEEATAGEKKADKDESYAKPTAPAATKKSKVTRK